MQYTLPLDDVSSNELDVVKSALLNKYYMSQFFCSTPDIEFIVDINPGDDFSLIDLLYSSVSYHEEFIEEETETIEVNCECCGGITQETVFKTPAKLKVYLYFKK